MATRWNRRKRPTDMLLRRDAGIVPRREQGVGQIKPLDDARGRLVRKMVKLPGRPVGGGNLANDKRRVPVGPFRSFAPGEQELSRQPAYDAKRARKDPPKIDESGYSRSEADKFAEYIDVATGNRDKEQVSNDYAERQITEAAQAHGEDLERDERRAEVNERFKQRGQVQRDTAFGRRAPGPTMREGVSERFKRNSNRSGSFGRSDRYGEGIAEGGPWNQDGGATAPISRRKPRNDLEARAMDLIKKARRRRGGRILRG
jgi:hypothetical protein